MIESHFTKIKHLQLIFCFNCDISHNSKEITVASFYINSEPRVSMSVAVTAFPSPCRLPLVYDFVLELRMFNGHHSKFQILASQCRPFDIN